VPAEGRRRCDGDTEGAAQQQFGGSAPGGFSGPPGDGSHAFIQSPRSCDSGRSSGRQLVAPRSRRDRCGHRSVGGRLLSAQGHRSRSGAVAEELTQCRGGMVLPRQDSRRRGPPSPLQCPASPGTGRCLLASHSLLFYNLRTGELVHPVRAKHFLPGDRHGPWNSFRSMPSDAASTGLSSAAPGAPGEPSTGVGGGRRTAGLPCFCAPNGDSVSELTWLSGDL
jgi:hypothetical protein